MMGHETTEQRLYLTVLLYVKPGMDEQFQDYERKVRPIIESYGGRFEKIIRPANISGELAMPDEVHWLSFPSEQSFLRYRTDPVLPQLAHMRASATAKTIIISGSASPEWR
jgi:uncharacterized protein (DUF1330 family)